MQFVFARRDVSRKLNFALAKLLVIGSRQFVDYHAGSMKVECVSVNVTRVHSLLCLDFESLIPFPSARNPIQKLRRGGCFFTGNSQLPMVLDNRDRCRLG